MHRQRPRKLLLAGANASRLHQPTSRISKSKQEHVAHVRRLLTSASSTLTRLCGCDCRLDSRPAESSNTKFKTIPYPKALSIPRPHLNRRISPILHDNSQLLSHATVEFRIAGLATQIVFFASVIGRPRAYCSARVTSPCHNWPPHHSVTRQHNSVSSGDIEFCDMIELRASSRTQRGIRGRCLQ